MPLLGFILRRVLQTIPTIAFILVVTFVLVRLLPGDPASAMLGDRAIDADVERINAKLGLDKSIPVQFLYFTRTVFTGDLGNSIGLKLPVLDLIMQRLPVTLMLTGDGGTHRAAAGRAAVLRRRAQSSRRRPTPSSAAPSRSGCRCRSSMSGWCC